MFYPNQKADETSEKEESEDGVAANYLSTKLVGEIYAAAKLARDDSDAEV